MVLMAAMLLWGGCGNRQQQTNETRESGEEKKEATAAATPKIEVSSFGFGDSPVDVLGCSCCFSFNKEDYTADKFIFLFDYGDNVVMRINGEMIIFKVEYQEDGTPAGESDKYKIHITQEDADEEGGYESSSYKGVITLTDKSTGNSVQQEYWGVCGC